MIVTSCRLSCMFDTGAWKAKLVSLKLIVAASSVTLVVGLFAKKFMVRVK